jgi:Uma2 family endonuclease
MAADPKAFLTLQEYLDLERQSETKHEYVDGTIVAMVGASPSHNRIQTNLTVNIFPSVDPRGCEIFGSDMKVRIERLNIYTYPDLTVVCGPPEFTPEKPAALLNPQVIFEILSPATETYDRAGKFARYRRIPSFREYVLITQDMPMIEHYVRLADGTWNWSAVERLEDSIVLPSLDCILSLSKIYARVEFSPDSAAENPGF